MYFHFSSRIVMTRFYNRNKFNIYGHDIAGDRKRLEK